MDRVPRDPGRGGRADLDVAVDQARPDGQGSTLQHPKWWWRTGRTTSKLRLQRAVHLAADTGRASADRRRRRPPKPAFSRCAFEAVARFLADPRSVAATTPCQNWAVRRFPGSHCISITGPTSRQPWLRRTAVQR